MLGLKYLQLFLLVGKDTSKKIEDSLAALEALALSSAMKLSPLGVQASLRYLCRSLSNLHAGCALDEKTDQVSGMVRRALGRFQYFMEWPCPTKKGSVLRGDVAYEACFGVLSQDKLKGNPLDHAALEQLQLFLWLAGANQAAVCELLKDSAAEIAKGSKKQKVAAKSSSSSAAASSSSAAGSSKEIAVDSGKKAAMAMFSS